MNLLVRLAIVAGMVALSATAGYAQQRTCSNEVVATGKGALTEDGAKKKSRNKVVLKSGG